MNIILKCHRPLYLSILHLNRGRVGDVYPEQ